MGFTTAADVELSSGTFSVKPVSASASMLPTSLFNSGMDYGSDSDDDSPAFESGDTALPTFEDLEYTPEAVEVRLEDDDRESENDEEYPIPNGWGAYSKRWMF